MTTHEQRLALLREYRREIVENTKRAGRTVLSDADDTKFRALSEEIDALSEDIDRSAAKSAAGRLVSSVRMSAVLAGRASALKAACTTSTPRARGARSGGIWCG